MENPFSFTCCDEDVSTVLSQFAFSASFTLFQSSWAVNYLCGFCVSSAASFLLTDMECADVPLLTPSSKEMMSQALKATFSGFTKEQQRLGIPKGILLIVGKGTTGTASLGKAHVLSWLRSAAVESAVMGECRPWDTGADAVLSLSLPVSLGRCFLTCLYLISISGSLRPSGISP